MTGSIEQRAESVIQPILQDLGYELVAVQCRREAAGWILRLFIDREGGPTLDDCARVSQAVGPALEVEDLVPYRYRLEVSSPGVDRPLTKEADFQRFQGRRARIRTAEVVGDRRRFSGILEGCEGGTIRIAVEGLTHAIPLATVREARLQDEGGRVPGSRRR